MKNFCFESFAKIAVIANIYQEILGNIKLNPY